MIKAVLIAIFSAGRITNALTIKGTAAAWKSGCIRFISGTAFGQTLPIAMWLPMAIEAGISTAIGAGNKIATANGSKIAALTGTVIATAIALIGSRTSMFPVKIRVASTAIFSAG